MRKITRIKCLIVVLLTFIGTLAPVHAQQSGNFEISGVVKDTSGEPVIGATVIVKNTQIGTTTDVDGKFKLKVPRKSLLQISFIGMKTKDLKVTNNTFYEITLEDESVLLDEVVAIGYGTQSKATVTSGVVSVKKAELMSSVSASPLISVNRNLSIGDITS